MNDLVRPSSFFTGGIAASAPSGVLATIPNPPPEVTRLPSGTTLRGIVIGTDGKGHVLVKTNQGTLAVATKAHLATNSEVVLQIRSSGVQLHVMIMQTRGQGAAFGPAPQSAAQNTGAPSSSGGVGTSQTAGFQPGTTGNPSATPLPPIPGRADPLNLGQTVRAVVQGTAGPAQSAAALQPGTQGAAAAGNRAFADAQTGQLPRPAPGTILPLRVLSVSAPGPTPNVTASAGPGPAVSGTLGPLGFTPPGPQGPTGALPPASGPVTVGVPVNVALSSTANAAGTPAAPSLAAQNPVVAPAAAQSNPTGFAGVAGDALTTPLRFTGLVTSVTHAGHPVLSTPLGTLSLEVEARLPGGSRVALELAPGGLPKAVESQARMATAASLGHAWPALEEALTVLSDLGAGATQRTLQGVPQPGARLASGMLFFLAALSGGNLGRWLGADALQTLRASGRDALVGRLSRDLAQMGRMADGAGGPSTAGDWRLLPIPLWDGDHVHQLRLFLRQHENRRDGGKKRDRRDPTRFILELEMSRLGEMQLDGLIRDKRFDLMMRTRGAMPDNMRVEIRRIFDDANQAAGYAGNLGFQASADWHFLPISQDTSTGAQPGLVV